MGFVERAISAIVAKLVKIVRIARPMWKLMLLCSMVAACAMLTPHKTVDAEKRPLKTIAILVRKDYYDDNSYTDKKQILELNAKN